MFKEAGHDGSPHNCCGCMLKNLLTIVNDTSQPIKWSVDDRSLFHIINKFLKFQ